MEKKYRWVNDSVKIDFPLPKPIQEKVDMLEYYDETEDYGYFDACEVLECYAKHWVPDESITQEQFEKLCDRYCGG
ncbi:hypothetical protein [Fusibacillus kribbianus]|uniref:Uncharacterized protein n=1 Tax=Fusibacillus kribbianus TaxID=3044208 RepID=A0AAP4BCQ6_9FIRM|nr:hypothetical protein [Ruminococcus sp. YH-rum2234]MDI9242331.1 hypothetical protein [Ruminococcus sp. YH-rum2234]